MRRLFRSLGKGLSAFFGGFASYAFIAFGVVLLLLWMDYRRVKSENETLSDNVQTLEKSGENKDRVSDGQDEQYDRTQASNADLKELEDKINALEKTHDCSRSPAMRAVLQQLYDAQAGRTGDADDEQPVSLQRGRPSPESGDRQ